MKGLFLTLNLLLLILGSACQVKEKTSNGSLVSNHNPAANSFKLQTPISKTYVNGETISLVLTFPYPVTVTGTPRLVLTIGAATRYADFSSGDGTSSLIFQYAVAGGDNDPDGIAVNSIDLNGGTLTFDLKGVITNCSTAFAAKTLSGVKVDNTIPTPTAMKLTNPVGFYHKDETLNFTVTFSEPVKVTGTPQILMDFSTGPAKYATYAGGSGTNVLAFSLTITNDIADSNNYDSIGNIELNGGTIKDLVGNDASLDISAYVANVQADGNSRKFDGRVPYVVSVTPPADGTYVASQTLSVDVEFDRNVTVTNVPTIGLTIGSTVRQAQYVSGSGTKVLRFSYTAVPGDVDADGIGVATSLTQPAGSDIRGTSAPANSFFSPAANNAYTVPSTTGVLVNSVQPTPVSVTRNADTTNRVFPTAILDDTWIIDQPLLISVTFNTGMYVDQTLGTPRIPLTVGSETRYATYLSGGNGQTALVFRYVIQENDLDMDGSIEIGSIDLNGGNITDAANTNTLLALPVTALASTKIDGERPTITSVAAPANGTYSPAIPLDITVTWSEPVNYATPYRTIPLTIGATPVNAVYNSGSNSDTIIHRPALANPMTDTDGIEISSPLTGTGVVRDQAGNTATVFTFTPPASPGVLVDTTAPSVVSVDAPTPGTYYADDDLYFTVHFDEIVEVNSNGTYPRIAIAMDSGTKYATYLSGSGTADIVFQYKIVSGDSDLNGITNPTIIDINSATNYIRDAYQNMRPSPYDYPITVDMTGVVVDALAPYISSRTFPDNGTYKAGNVLKFTTTFNETVTVSGAPLIEVNAQTGKLPFEYKSGSGTNVLTFEYTVTTDDFDFDGLQNPVNSITLNGGTIQDANGNDAVLTFSDVDLSSVYITFPEIALWSPGSTITNRIAAAVGVASSGVPTTDNCKGNPCRIFDGDDEFRLTGVLNNASEIFIVFKTSSTLSGMNLIEPDIKFVDDGAAFDLDTSDADISLDGGAPTHGVTHNTNMLPSTLHIMHVKFSTPENYGVGPLIPNNFRGAIGDVIIVTSPITNEKKDAILEYLNSKY